MTDSTHNTPSRRGRPRNFDRDKALVSALGLFWRCGYEPASVGELCRIMNINPPSLYAAFGSKAELFLEAVNFYERTYWDAPWERMLQKANVHDAIRDFFEESAVILTSQDAPCGCLVVLAAINVSPESKDVYDAVKALREEGRVYFRQRLQAGIESGQLPPDPGAGWYYAGRTETRRQSGRAAFTSPGKSSLIKAVPFERGDCFSLMGCQRALIRGDTRCKSANGLMTDENVATPEWTPGGNIEGVTPSISEHYGATWVW